MGRKRSLGKQGLFVESGYTLAALMIIIMLMSITLAVAMPSWNTFVKRDKEAEAVFRGLQYAEAIRVFQQRHGRLPTSLEELIKVEPRSIRQLYTNPLNESGKWGLLMQTQNPRGRNATGNPGVARSIVGAGGLRTRDRAIAAAGGTPQSVQAGGANNRGRGGVVAIPPAEDEEGGAGRRRAFGQPAARTTGPLVGVYPGVEGQSLRSFNGASNYNEWRFQSDMIPAPVILGGEAVAPRVTSAWIGKPFRSDLQIQSGQAGQAGQRSGAVNGTGLRRPGAPQRGNSTKDFRPGGSSKRGRN